MSAKHRALKKKFYGFSPTGRELDEVDMRIFNKVRVEEQRKTGKKLPKITHGSLRPWSRPQ